MPRRAGSEIAVGRETLLNQLADLPQPLHVCFARSTKPHYYIHLNGNGSRLYHKSRVVKSRSFHVHVGETTRDRVVFYGLLNDRTSWRLTIDRRSLEVTGDICHCGRLTIGDQIYEDRVIRTVLSSSQSPPLSPRAPDDNPAQRPHACQRPRMVPLDFTSLSVTPPSVTRTPRY